MSVVRTALRVLTFRATRDELRSLDGRHLAFGLVCTWLVGIGRYWDDPRAHVLQHFGVGSVVYVFVLALLLFLVIWPLAPREASYRRTLTFVTLTSPPAALYAIPVERFVDVFSASALNAWFLALVAAWRVALWLVYLRRGAGLRPFEIPFAALLPLTVVVTALTLLNLQHVTFDLMRGMHTPTADDAAYSVLVVLTTGSAVAVGPFAIAYAVFVVLAYKRRARERAATSSTRGSAAS